MNWNFNIVIEEEPRVFVYYITTNSGKCYNLRWSKSCADSEIIANHFASEIALEEYGCGYYQELKSVIGKLLAVGYRKMNLDKDFCYK